ncbi:tol-pal system protein YbgF [Desulfovibrio sp. X2]|uniref:tol-pal system protein YbgF n=1 Tax=Desulfovibrio sp. X2 TaxID=941449 RepID=UPI00035887AC|nr:tol-pal system protein YbgF [Desulfovibrio sp. X2]EPR39349.1 tol-pal system protein YbgF [Desulfovibrio sp. X2]
MRRVGLLICLMILLSGCSAAAGSDEWRLQNLEENFLQFKEAERQQEADQQKFAKDVTARLSVLEERLNQVEERLRHLESEDTGESSGADDTIQPMAVPEPPSSMSAASESPAEAAPKSSAAKAPELHGKALYERGVKLIMAEKYASARDDFTSYLESNPQGEYAPNALYWTGETYYGEQRYAQSILTFKEVLQKFPKSPKAPDALLKTAYAYEKLQDPKNAVFYLKALLDEYPKAEAAPLARAKLKELGQ